MPRDYRLVILGCFLTWVLTLISDCIKLRRRRRPDVSSQPKVRHQRLPTKNELEAMFRSRARFMFAARISFYILLFIKAIPNPDLPPATARDVAEIGLIVALLVHVTVDHQFHMHVDLPLTLKKIGRERRPKEPEPPTSEM